MILITTALYCEALPFIQLYHLKKDTAFVKFQVFKNEDMLLLITKPGAVQAAIAVASLCTAIAPAAGDIFLNLGVCGTHRESDSLGSVFLCNQIIDKESKRSFYPDLLLAHPYEERCVITSPVIINNKETDSERTGSYPGVYLIDMEASGLFQAASYFYQPHQMIFLKIVSDYLKNTDMAPEKITGLIQGNMTAITEWISQVKDGFSKAAPTFTSEEEKLLTELAVDLRLSVSSELKLRQLFKYYKLKEGGFAGRLKGFLSDTPLPCKTKTEGKKYFEQLKQTFI